MFPFLKILPLIILGILLSGWTGVSDRAVWTMLAVAWGMGWLTWRRGAAGQIYVSIALMLSGAAMARVYETKPVLPEGEKILLHLRITDNLHVSETNARWQHTSARVGYWRQPAEDQWHRVDQKISAAAATRSRVTRG